MKGYISTVEEYFGVSWKALGLRILASFFLVTWIGFLPVYMIVHYMAYQHFFSYDLFNDGSFGLNSFVFVSGVMACFLSFALWGAVPFVWRSYKAKKNGEKHNQFRMLAWFFVFLSLFFHVVLLIKCFLADKFEIYAVFSFLGLLISLLACTFIGQPLKEKVLNWVPSVVFVFLTAMIPFLSQSANANLVSLGLKLFRIGGGVDVVAINSDSSELLAKGSLVLQTPDNLYISGDEGELVIIPYSQKTVIKIQ